MTRKNFSKLLAVVLALTMIMGLSVTSFARDNTVTATITIEFQDSEDATTFISDGIDYEITVPAGYSLYDLIEAEKDEFTGELPYDPVWDSTHWDSKNNVYTKYLTSYYWMDEDPDYYGYYPGTGNLYTYGSGWTFFVDDGNGNLYMPYHPQFTRPSDGAKWHKSMDQYIVQDGDHIYLRYGYCYTESDQGGYMLDFQWLLPGQIAN